MAFTFCWGDCLSVHVEIKPIGDVWDVALNEVILADEVTLPKCGHRSSKEGHLSSC